MTLTKVVTIPLPKDKRYYNHYVSKQRAILSMQNFGASVLLPVPAEGDDPETAESVPLSTDFVFDHDERPTWISKTQWKNIQRAVYSAFLLGAPDTMKHLYAGVQYGDGRGIIDRIREAVGSVMNQQDYFNREFLKNILVNKQTYHQWYGELMDLYTQYNFIHGLPEAERMTEAQIKVKFLHGIGKIFPAITVASDTNPNLSVDELHQLCEAQLDREDVQEITDIAAQQTSEAAQNSSEPALANYGHYDNGYQNQGGHQHYGGSQHGGQSGEYWGPFNEAADNNFSYWTNSNGKGGYGPQRTWRSNYRQSPYQGKGGKGKGFGAKGFGGKGKGGHGQGRGYAKFAFSVILEDLQTGEQHRQDRGQVDCEGKFLQPSAAPWQDIALAQASVQLPTPAPAPAPALAPASTTELRMAPHVSNFSPVTNINTVNAPGPWWMEKDCKF